MNFLDQINDFFGIFVGYLAPVLFYSINGFPLIVLVLLAGALVFTFYFKFINIRGFGHSIDIIKGKYDNPKDTGQISHFQALTSALSATIGLGNIAGVAVAVSLGGPGAVFWMVFIAFFSMSAKFVSCTLGQTYRTVNDDGSVSGGPMYYLSKGLKDRGFMTLGKILGAMYAVFIIGGAFGGGNMFQANQSYELFGKLIGIPDYLYGILLALLVGAVIIGGIKRIGQTTEKIVPAMVVLYVGASLFIILTNIEKLPGVLSSILNQAFAPHAAYGGFIGALVTGIKRAVFSNEGGVGSASIAHSAAKTDEPVREGIVAMIGPFIDTIVVCFMTASVILITAESNPLDVTDAKLYISDNANEMDDYNLYYTEDWRFIRIKDTVTATHLAEKYEDKPIQIQYDISNNSFEDDIKGAELTSAAFGSSISWFPYILSIVVFLFSFSTMISWYYYGDKGWKYLFGGSSIKIYQGLYLGCVVLGSVASLGNVIDFSDMMILSCGFPNIIGCMFLLPIIKNQLNDYWSRYKNGQFKTYK
ncbi:MAG: hypothetical protein CMG00_01330 [Candidatus Marinimicrobia bacterium]|nr:hypothetical protein [Candidatus Neomarinimicrobiota bacterium]